MVLFPLKSVIIAACNHEEVTNFVSYNCKLLLIIHYLHGMCGCNTDFVSSVFLVHTLE